MHDYPNLVNARADRGSSGTIPATHIMPIARNAQRIAKYGA